MSATVWARGVEGVLDVVAGSEEAFFFRGGPEEEHGAAGGGGEAFEGAGHLEDARRFRAALSLAPW